MKDTDAHLLCPLFLKTVLIILVIGFSQTYAKRSFRVDSETNEFLKDGKVFRYVSGEMHYFRVPTELWQDRLLKMKYGGLNVVQTYIEWSSIERKPGVYDFSGNNNITHFMQLAQNEGLLVILRPGPYICAERDMGGLPSWLLKASANMRLRSSNGHYLSAVERWLTVLFEAVRPFLYENGGPVIMLQVENEFGSYDRSTSKPCDSNYTSTLRDTYRRLLGQHTVLFTTDGNGHNYFRCGRIDDVFATIDFGIMNQTNVQKAFNLLRQYQPTGPKVNSEFYSGWLDYWERPHQIRSSKAFASTLDIMLAMNASVNIYMYHGGTNFGFSGGSNIDPVFHPVPTSYDYDAPISECGDLTDKFFAVKRVIEKYTKSTQKYTNSDTVESQVSRYVKPIERKMKLPPIELKYKASIFEVLPNSTWSKVPLSFEQLDHAHGFLLYSSRVKFHPTDPAILSIPDLHDRAHVFVDKEFAGTLSVTRKALQLPIYARNGSNIDILVENQGRIFYGPGINQRKGILSAVYLSDHVISSWHHYRLFEDWTAVTSKLVNAPAPKQQSPSPRVPSFFTAKFVLDDEYKEQPLDSFLKLSGWTKGVAFLNGHNLGRFWPVAGPQLTLYAPAVFFRPYPEENEIVIFEHERNPCFSSDSTINSTKCSVQFVDKHIINAAVPTPMGNRKPPSFVQKET